MPFEEHQIRKLKARLQDKYVRTRTNNGLGWSYIEGWHAISEANRIFGFDAWDRQTLAAECVWNEAKDERHHAAYTAKVRVTVRAGDIIIIREGSGTGEGKALTPGQAHELALKGAETDATKRALATFGNPFGLALYDRDQPRKAKASRRFQPLAGPWILRSSTGEAGRSFADAGLFAEALRTEMHRALDIGTLFDIWERNVATVRTLNRSGQLGTQPGIAQALVADLKACAVALADKRMSAKQQSQGANGSAEPNHSRRLGRIDKSMLTIGEPKRHRCRAHLHFVTQQPCLICGRTPSQAHHVRYAQSRGLSLKVSDEFTVPLCAIHHHQVHRTGNERSWWEERGTDPLKVAQSLWQQTRERQSLAKDGSNDPIAGPATEVQTNVGPNAAPTQGQSPNERADADQDQS